MTTHKTPDSLCRFLRLPAELRVVVYEYLLSGNDDQQMWVDIWEDPHAPAYRHATVYSHIGFHPPHIRYVCKQTYTETTDIFFQHWKINFTFTEVTQMQDFFAGIGAVNRQGLRHLGVMYHTLGENGERREDLDLEYWAIVAENLKKSFAGDDRVMLETLELETADDRDAAVRFGGSPRTDPRLVAIKSTVQVIKLAQVFPYLTRLVLEDVVLLQPEDCETEYTWEELPIVNFMRRS